MAFSYSEWKSDISTYLTGQELTEDQYDLAYRIAISFVREDFQQYSIETQIDPDPTFINGAYPLPNDYHSTVRIQPKNSADSLEEVIQFSDRTRHTPSRYKIELNQWVMDAESFNDTAEVVYRAVPLDLRLNDWDSKFALFYLLTIYQGLEAACPMIGADKRLGTWLGAYERTKAAYDRGKTLRRSVRSTQNSVSPP